MDAGWSSEQVEGFCTVHGESDGGAAGFYWGADGSRDPFWWSGGGGWPPAGSDGLAATFARTLGANGLHIHQLVTQSRAQMGELRTAWSRAARVDADASMSRSRHRHSDRPTSCGGDGGGDGGAAEEEAAAEEEELLLGSWASSEPMWPPTQHRWKCPPPSGRTARRPCAWRIPASPRQPRCCSCWWRSG